MGAKTKPNAINFDQNQNFLPSTIDFNFKMNRTLLQLKLFLGSDRPISLKRLDWMRLDQPRSFHIWLPLNLQPTMWLRIGKILTVTNLFQCCAIRRKSLFRQTKVDISPQFLSIRELNDKEFLQDLMCMKIDFNRSIMTLKLHLNPKMFSVWSIKKNSRATPQNTS